MGNQEVKIVPVVNSPVGNWPSSFVEQSEANSENDMTYGFEGEQHKHLLTCNQVSRLMFSRENKVYSRELNFLLNRMVFLFLFHKMTKITIAERGKSFERKKIRKVIPPEKYQENVSLDNVEVEKPEKNIQESNSNTTEEIKDQESVSASPTNKTEEKT